MVKYHDLAIPLPAIHPTEINTKCPHKNLYVNVQSSTIHHSPKKWKPKYPSTEEQRNKMWHMHIREQYSLIKEMKYWFMLHHKPWKHYTKWQKPDTKGYIYCTIPEIPRRGKFIDTESTSVVAMDWRDRDCLLMNRDLFLERWKCSQIGCGGGCTILNILKNHWIVRCKLVNYHSCTIS